MRPSARVVLINSLNQVLMIKVSDKTVIDPNNPVPDEFWVTVGGALEIGETFEDAACREIFEETGIHNFELGPCIWEQTKEMNWQGKLIQTFEKFFLGFVTSADVTFTHVNAHEASVFRSYKWWSLDEMRSSDETFRPVGFTDLIEPILRRRFDESWNES